MDDLLTTRQLMDLLQLDRTTIYRMLNDGRLPAVRVGGQWRFLRQSIEALIQAQTFPASGAERKPAEKIQSPVAANIEVLPLHCLQPIQEVFAQTAGIGSVTTDLDGKPLTSYSNPCAFCSLILAAEKGRLRCQDSWRKLAGVTEKEPRLEKCHAGLTYARGWITVDDASVAMIFGGQFIVRQGRSVNSQEHIARIARNCELDEEPLRKAAREVRVLTQDHAEKLLRLLQLVADTFSTIGQERLDLLTRLKKVAELADMAQG
jgi:excisionase family DNA binding protein